MEPVDAESARATSAAVPGERSSRLEWTKAIGMPLVTLLVTVLGGYYFTSLTREREARESDERLYAQLLTQREQSDATIRKDMFGAVISRFLSKAKEDSLSNRVLQLELLASNFNQSLDLAPLFKTLARQLDQGSRGGARQNAELKRRLDLSASNTIFKQLNNLARRGFIWDRHLSLAGWEKSVGKPFIDEKISLAKLVPSTTYVPVGDTDSIRFSVELLGVDIDKRGVEVRLRVDLPGGASQDIDRHFWVDQYDFPMLDNTQLPYGLRTSVAITKFFVPDAAEDREANTFVTLHLVVFPSASASLKERQDYDDILLGMLHAKGQASRRDRKQP